MSEQSTPGQQDPQEQVPHTPVPLTVGAVASQLGVSVRTLHHWDEIGLISPSERSAGGYRIYSGGDLSRLHRVLIYRELEIPLAAIKDLLESSAEELSTALEQQHHRLEERIERLQGLRSTVDRLIAAHQQGLLLSPEEQLRLFGPTWNPQWAQKARQTWGDSPQWAEYAERSASRSAQHWEQLTARVQQLEADLAQAVDAGMDPVSSEAAELVELHRASISEHFHCSRSMQICLARMYTEDERFRSHYDSLAEGLADWLRAAVEANARAHGIDPDTATWE